MRFSGERVSMNDGLCNTNGGPQQLAALGMFSDSNAVNDATDRHKTVQEIVDSEDAEADVAVAGQCCTRAFLPLLTVALVLGVILGVILTSGSATEAKGSPRAVLLIIEGFKGTTFNDLLERGRLPHIQRMLMEQHGVYSVCATVEDVRCARAMHIEDDVTGESFISSGAGIASILTGVSPQRHRVRSDSWKSYSTFSETCTQFPSVAVRVTRAGMKTIAIGTSHLLNGLDPKTGECSRPGVLDAECDGSTPKLARHAEKRTSTFPPLNSLQQAYDAAAPAQGVRSQGVGCMQKRSCNLFKRLVTFPGARDGEEEQQYTELLTELSGGLGGNGQGSGDTSDSDVNLFIFHIDALARRAGDADLPEFTYEKDSLEYAAQAFLIDTLVGQVLALVRSRVHTRKENWLVLGTSDHGGVGKSFGRFGDADEVVPFFLATYTTNSRGYTQLRPLTRPVTHMDATPTILKWLGIAPYDTNELEGGDREGNKEPTAVDEGQLRSSKRRTASTHQSSIASSAGLLDGQPQGICGSGLQPHDCGVLGE